MKQTLMKLLLVGLGGLLSASCVSSSPFLERNMPRQLTPWREQNPPQELTRWVDEQLIPYVVKQFKHHPRFKGQRFLVVSMRGDEVQPEIDNLTHYIRDRIRTTLRHTPGIHSRWYPPTLRAQHPRHLADLPCGEFNQIHYYVGVDIQRLPLDNTVEVAVRALDVAEQRWVSGFHQSWHGQLSLAQRLELSRRHQDESLRGRRTLPFTVDQPDLLAAYLAHNLRCLLRHRHSPEGMVLYTPPPESETCPYFRTALDLVGNYLGQFREVQTTDDPAQATVLLEGQVYPLHHNLHQVWVTLRHAQNRRALTGTETEAYVHLAPTARQRDEPPAPPQATRSNTPPRPTLYGSLRRSDPDPGVDSKAIASTSSPVSPDSKKLLKELRLRSINNRTECVTKNRGFGKRWTGLLGTASPDTPCLAIETTVHRSARLVLVGQNSRGQFRWLTPSPCQNKHPAGIHLPTGQTFRLALPPEEIQFLELDQRRGQSWVYAIAIAEQAVDEILDERWIHVRDTVAKKLRHNASSYARVIVNRLGLCEQRRHNQRPPSSWVSALKTIAAESGSRLEWQGIRLWHGRDSRL